MLKFLYGGVIALVLVFVAWVFTVISDDRTTKGYYIEMEGKKGVAAEVPHDPEKNSAKLLVKLIDPSGTEDFVMAYCAVNVLINKNDPIVLHTSMDGNGVWAEKVEKKK
jgi:hypothetical protein